MTGPRIWDDRKRYAIFLSEDRQRVFLVLQGRFWGFVSVGWGAPESLVRHELNQALLEARVNLRCQVARLFVPKDSPIFPSVVYAGEPDFMGNPAFARMFYPREFQSYVISKHTLKFVELLKDGAFMKA